jgi:hypothetical protein
VTRRPTAQELLATPGALLVTDALRELGLDDRAIARAQRALPILILPDVQRLYLAAEDVRGWLHAEGA